MYVTEENPVSTPRKRRMLHLLVGLLAIGSVIGYIIYQTVSPKYAALLVEANPESIVYIDGAQKGKTPLEVELEDEIVTLKVEPEDTHSSPYEVKLKLAEGVKTIVRRNFESDGVGAEGQIISFEKHLSAGAAIAVVSIPDVHMFVDGNFSGTTPVQVFSPAGTHTIKLVSEGFVSQEFQVEAIGGYKVTIVAELSKVKE